MGEYKKIPTSAEVYAVIKAKHHGELKPFSSYSAPEGDARGGFFDCVMMTEYGFEGCDFPIIGIENRWRKHPEISTERVRETYKYWLCVAEDDYEAE